MVESMLGLMFPTSCNHTMNMLGSDHTLGMITTIIIIINN